MKRVLPRIVPRLSCAPLQKWLLNRDEKIYALNACPPRLHALSLCTCLNDQNLNKSTCKSCKQFWIWRNNRRFFLHLNFSPFFHTPFLSVFLVLGARIASYEFLNIRESNRLINRAFMLKLFIATTMLII